jgi:hypothetical protein
LSYTAIGLERCRKLHNEEFRNLNIVERIKLLRVIWAGHVALLGLTTNAYKIWA